MNKSHFPRSFFFTAILCALALILTAAPSAHAELAAQYKSADYDAQKGVWKDSSGHDHDASIPQPADKLPPLTTSATPNGSPAVQLADSAYFEIANGGIASKAYTIFAYIKVDKDPGNHSIVGGPNHSLGYRLAVKDDNTFKQHIVRTNIGPGFDASTSHPTDQFCLISITVKANGGTFYFNDSDDGPCGATWFDGITYPITLLGAGTIGGSGSFHGQIAEVRIYDTQLTDQQRADIEKEITTAYAP